MDVQRFAANSTGRDFVVGDLHGCFAQLDRVLARAAFDPQRDRLFSVGDLVDRGPHSEAALDWLAQPWFHACRGNHEQMILELGASWRSEPGWFLLNGGDWWMGLAPQRRAAYIDAFAALPYAMEVHTPWGDVGIVHADVDPDMTWPEFCAALERGEERARAVAVWSRLRADGATTAGVAEIDRVVCGHTITPERRVRVQANVWFIDTGAFLDPNRDGLALLSLQSLFAERVEDGPRRVHGL